MMDFRELAAAVGRRLYFGEANGELRLAVTTDTYAPALVRPLNIALRAPGGRVPDRVVTSADGRVSALNVRPRGNGAHSLLLPPADFVKEDGY